MTFPKQKTFGEFIRDRYGPNWVYAHRMTNRIRSRYSRPDPVTGEWSAPVVITPAQQKALRDDYAKEWGRENDEAFWHMLCALRATKEALHGQESDYPLTIAAVDAALRSAAT